MESAIRRRLSTAARALDFATAHPVADPSFGTVLKRLDTLVSQADAIALQENEGRTGERAALARRSALRRSIRRTLLRRLVRTAELAIKEHPELKGQFLLPREDLPNKTFLIAARAMLATALPQKEIFAPLGLDQAFFDQLSGELDKLGGSTATAHNGRSDHVGARADLKTLARECRRDVDVLETFYLGALPTGSDLLAAWESARNLPGPFKHQAAPVVSPPPEPVAPASSSGASDVSPALMLPPVKPSVQ